MQMHISPAEKHAMAQSKFRMQQNWLLFHSVVLTGKSVKCIELADFLSFEIIEWSPLSSNPCALVVAIG